MVGADAPKVGPRTGAEVERRHREAAAHQTHHVGAAGSAVLHVAQIRAVLQQSVAASEGSIQIYVRPAAGEPQELYALYVIPVLTFLSSLQAVAAALTCSPGTCSGGGG